MNSVSGPRNVNPASPEQPSGADERPVTAGDEADDQDEETAAGVTPAPQIAPDRMD